MKIKTKVKEQKNNKRGAKGEIFLPFVIQKVKIPLIGTFLVLRKENSWSAFSELLFKCLHHMSWLIQ